jgi:hypothetical protein
VFLCTPAAEQHQYDVLREMVETESSNDAAYNGKLNGKRPDGIAYHPSKMKAATPGFVCKYNCLRSIHRDYIVL